MSRRREDRVIACPICSEVLAIYEEGARVPPAPHACAKPEIDFSELSEMVDEMRATRKPEE